MLAVAFGGCFQPTHLVMAVKTYDSPGVPEPADLRVALVVPTDVAATRYQGPPTSGADFFTIDFPVGAAVREQAALTLRTRFRTVEVLDEPPARPQHDLLVSVRITDVTLRWAWPDRGWLAASLAVNGTTGRGQVGPLDTRAEGRVGDGTPFSGLKGTAWLDGLSASFARAVDEAFAGVLASPTVSAAIGEARNALRPDPVALARDVERRRQVAAELSPQRRLASNELLRQAFELFREGQFEAAVIRFNDGLEIDPANGLAHFYLAESLERLGRRAAALEHYRLVEALAPDSRESAIARAKIAPK